MAINCHLLVHHWIYLQDSLVIKLGATSQARKGLLTDYTEQFILGVLTWQLIHN